MIREALFAVALLAALALIVYGVSLVSLPSAFVTAGVGVAGVAFLFLAEVNGP